MSGNDWKKRLGTVYSTNPDFNYEEEELHEEETLEPSKQNLIVRLDKKNRKGKAVSLVQGFIGNVDDLKDLAKELKTKLGVGGSVKDGEIVIQGDFRDKIVKVLTDMSYKAKRGN